MIVEKFSISIWFSLLFAVSFSGAIFGLYGTSAAVAMFVMALILGFATLWFAHRNRQQKNALKVPADAMAILGLICFAVTLPQFGLVVALIEMLFFLQLALNLYFREHRQVYFGLIACFVALMSGAIHTFRAGYLLYILFFCVFASFYLAECHIDKRLNLFARSQQTHSHSNEHNSNSKNNHSTQANYTNDTDHASHLQTQAFGYWSIWRRIWLVTSICLVAGIIYLVIPRFPAGNLGSLPLKGWGVYDDSYFQKNLLAENSDLSDKFYPTPNDSNQTPDQTDTADADDIENTINQNTRANDGTEHTDPSSYVWDKSIYFYVKTNQPRYYQVQTKTYFDGASWHALQYAYKRMPKSRDKRIFQLYPVQPNASIDITVAKDVPTHIISTDNTVGIGFPSDDVGRDYYDGLKTTQHLRKDTFYQLHVYDDYINNRLVDKHQAPPDGKDLQLPKTLDPRVAQLAEEVVLGSRTDWQKALKLEQHMRSNYHYSLSSLANQNNIPVRAFLFEHKTGHCEYFATSLALMLRTQGIPARMVSGFVGEDYNPVTGFYEVKGINGHAWVEAFLDGVWVILEGTGAYQQPQQNPQQNTSDNTNNNAHQELKDYLENLKTQDKLLNDDTPKSLTEQLRDFWYGLLLALQQIWQSIKSLLPFMLSLMLLAVGCWFLLQQAAVSRYLVQLKNRWHVQRVLRKLHKYQPTDAKTAAQFYMQCLQSLLEKRQIMRAAGTTIGDYTHALRSQKLISDTDATWLCDYIDTCFYGGHNQNNPLHPENTNPNTLAQQQARMISIIQKLASE